MLNGQELQALQYKLYDTEEVRESKKKKENPGFVNIFLSQHVAIPYIIEGENNIKIQIKYLHDLQSDK